jgi:hypothetical protein
MARWLRIASCINIGDLLLLVELLHLTSVTEFSQYLHLVVCFVSAKY